MRTLLLASLLWGLVCMAAAQPDQHNLPPAGPGAEAIDRTRLDVQNLPPEALHVTRALYSRGLFLEAQLGGVTFVGDARKLSHAGPRLSVALGYELTEWLALLVQLEGSLHQTDNRPPPAQTAYSLAGAALGARFSLPIDERYAIWAAGLLGFVWTSGDVLHALGFRDADNLGLSYGGELGFDWHLRSRHHSLGLLSGARVLPSLAKSGTTILLYGAGYLRYVF
jgi:hypothetical protein